MSLARRIQALEGRIEPPGGTEESKWRATRRQYAERLDELARIYQREGETIKNRTAALQEQGYSEFDARLIVKDEVVRAKNPELADFFDSSYPPEIRHDAIAKHRWLSDYIESRRTGRSARA
jgi:hypothetical protein